MMSHKYLFESERLLYRKFHEADAAAFFELNNDPLVIRYTGDPPFASVEDARQFLRSYDHYQHNGFGRWSIDLKETGELIGWAGLKFSKELDEIDVGCRFFQRYWRKGFGFESVEASVRYGFEQLELPRIVARAMQANRGSLGIMKKLGMRYLGEREFERHDGVLYEISREDWLAQRA